MLFGHHVLQNKGPDSTFPDKTTITRVLLDGLLADRWFDYIEPILGLRLIKLLNLGMQANAILMFHFWEAVLVVSVLDSQLLLKMFPTHCQMIESNDFLILLFLERSRRVLHC